VAPAGRIPVLHIIHTFDVGGAERQLVTLLGAFDRDRFEHHVGVMNWPGFLADEVRADRTLHFVDFAFRHRNFLPSLLRIVRYLRSHRIAVVHAHLHLVGIYARIAARMAGTPVAVYTEHSDLADRSSLSLAVERALVRWTALKITVSEEQRALTIRREGFPPERVITMSNSVPNERFAPDAAERRRTRAAFGFTEGDVVVGIVGRVEERKRVGHLLRIVSGLASGHPSLRVLVVGDGPELDLTIDLARELGLERRVVFAGRRQDVAAMMRALDVLAITSRWEGLPINMLEAMSAACPIVATAVGDVPKVLEASGAGITAPVEDADAFASALSALVQDAQERGRRGQAARRYVLDHHDASLNCRRLERLYVELLERAGRSPGTSG
jgi:L-malate glycosyltransferase